RHIPRFRILVIGRANAGKTTILQRVCSTTDHPKIYNGKGRKLHDINNMSGSIQRGHHNIEDELVFRSNPRFVFHDSCGFEAGSEEQFDLMTKFVMDRAKTSKLNERIHAIWFCIPLTDGHRLVTAAETKFFEVCDTGHVPVIVLATKADTLELEAIERLEDERFGADDSVGPEEMAKEILKNYMARLKTWLGNARFPPRDYLPLKGMQREDAGCTSLITCTANALREQGLQQLLISTQQSNLKLCMNFAIMK
ncbi:GTP-binding protein, partial [Pisolithus croceorrhizus]